MKLLFAAVVAAALPFGASAAPLGAVDLLRQFNLITTGDVQVQSLHVHGRALIGGTVTGNMAEVNHDAIDNIVASDFDELVLGSTSAATHVRVLGGGSASYNGTSGLIEASAKSNPAVAPKDYAAVLGEFSADLSALTSNVTADKTTFGNRITFGAAATDALSVYSITTADLLGREIEYALNGADAILINLFGSGDFSFVSNSIGNKAISTNVIWNFVGFNNISLYTSVFGSVLAEGSHVFLGADLEGSLFAGSLTGRAQIHVQPLDFPGLPEDPTPVPVPASLPFLMGGVAVLAGLRRKKRA